MTVKKTTRQNSITKAKTRTAYGDLSFRLLLGLTAVFGVLQIFYANSLSSQGREISRLDSLRGDLDLQIQSLREESSSLSSLENIGILAKQKLNMVDGFESFDYFKSAVALK
ncbi:MAG: hypothetical protein M1352_02800 [Patescibacteria group bacterium]|nr:hypothetical protein [Patescibacteria group bacterium]